MEIESRRVLHVGVTRHPTAEWTTQQLRDAIPADHSFRFLLRDRDAIYSPAFDSAVKSMGLRVLKTPPHAPKANAFAERLIGTFRRQCLDFFLVVNERHLRKILRECSPAPRTKRLSDFDPTSPIPTGTSPDSRFIADHTSCTSPI